MAVMTEDNTEVTTAPFSMRETGRALRERLVDLDSISWPVRLMMLFTAVFLLALLLVVAGIDTNLPWLTRTVVIFTQGTDHVYIVVYVLTLMAYLTGFTFLLTSILLSRGMLRYALTAALTFALGFMPIYHLTSRFSADHFVRWPYALQLALIAILWIAKVASDIGRGRGTPSRIGLGYAFSGSLLLVVAYYVLDYWNLFSAVVAEGKARQNVIAEVIQDVGLQSLFIGILALAMIYLASTSMVEMSETVSKAFLALVYKVRWQWMIGAFHLVVALAIIADVLMRAVGDGLGARLPATLVVLATGTAAAMYARSRPSSAPLLSFSSIVTGVALLWCVVELPYDAIMIAGGSDRLSDLGVLDFGIVISLLIVVGAGAYGLMQLQRARATGESRSSDTGVLLIVLSVHAAHG